MGKPAEAILLDYLMYSVYQEAVLYEPDYSHNLSQMECYLERSRTLRCSLNVIKTDDLHYRQQFIPFVD